MTNLTLPSPLFNRLQSGESVRRVEQMTVEACNWIGLTPLRDNGKDSRGCTCLDAIGCPYPPANTPVIVTDETTGATLDCVWGERGCKRVRDFTYDDAIQAGTFDRDWCCSPLANGVWNYQKNAVGLGGFDPTPEPDTWFFTSTISRNKQGKARKEME